MSLLQAKNDSRTTRWTRRRSLAFGVTAVLLCAQAAHAQGVPGVDANKCLAGKTKCLSKKIAGLMKCREKCQKKPDRCGQAQVDCEAKVMRKFDGGATPEKGCFAKLEAKANPANPASVCTTTGDTAAMDALVDGAVNGLFAPIEGEPAGPPICGNGIAEGGESCDAADLAGKDCTSFGFSASPGLACTAECKINLSACQTSTLMTGLGGFRDNGDGTVTDLGSGLMWEVKTGTVGGLVTCRELNDCPDPRNVNNTYLLITAVNVPETAQTIFLDQLNDVTGNGTNCFAGYCDWRLPSMPELKGLLLEPESAGLCSVVPCIDPSFPGPTAAFDHWTSTEDASDPNDVWISSFNGGFTTPGHKSLNSSVRAVRGGL